MAILAADAVGYSRLMAADELATLTELDAARTTFRQEVDVRGGRVVDTAGDSILAVFELATAAVSAALNIQDMLESAARSLPSNQVMYFRIGVHVGEVVEKADGSIYGDGVNIAARLQAMAEAGGVVISDAARAFVRGKLDAAFIDLGEQSVKNIPDPVRAFRVGRGTAVGFTSPGPGGTHPLPADRPSIAVLPFNNLSGDADQGYLADGMIDDLITALSRFRWLLVIARNSTFVYKGKSVDIKQVAQEMGVRYVLEGSVRRSGNRVRIIAQLINGISGAHIWAERFDGSLNEIFDFQDEITHRICTALSPEITAAEVERVHRQGSNAFDSWDAYIRALPLMREHTREANHQATELLRKATTISPSYSAAIARLSACRTQAAYYNWDGQRPACIAEAMELARRACALDPEEPLGLDALASAHQLSGDLENAAKVAQRAVDLSPSCTAAYGTLITSLAMLGRHQDALEAFAISERTSPRDPDRSSRLMGLTLAHFVAGHYGDAANTSKDYIALRPNWYGGHMQLAAASALCGNLAEARSALERLLQLIPERSCVEIQKRILLRRPSDVQVMLKGLELAGLPL